MFEGSDYDARNLTNGLVPQLKDTPSTAHVTSSRPVVVAINVSEVGHSTFYLHIDRPQLWVIGSAVVDVLIAVTMTLLVSASTEYARTTNY